MKFLEYIFGCQHRNVTWPRGTKGDLRIVCTDCGSEFPYSWERMKIGKKENRQVSRVPGLRPAVSLLGLLRAVVGLVFGSAEKRPGPVTSGAGGGISAGPIDSYRSGPYWTQHHTPWPWAESAGLGSRAALLGPSSLAEGLALRRDQNVLGETSDS